MKTYKKRVGKKKIRVTDFSFDQIIDMAHEPSQTGKDHDFIRKYKESFGSFIKNKEECRADLLKRTSMYNEGLLLQACLYNHEHFIRFLADGLVNVNKPFSFISQNYTPLRVAYYKDKLLAMRALLQSKADLPAPDDNGNSLLHQAIADNKIEAAHILVEHGAPLEAINKIGLTALGRAVIKQNYAATKMLVESGAQTNLPITVFDGTRESLLHVACQVAPREIVDLLIDHGADLEALDSNGHTPLCRVVVEKNYEATSLLIQRGAHKSIAQKTGLNLLYQACTSDALDIAKLLLENGAEPDELIPGNECTPFFAVTALNFFSGAKLLLDYGADIQAKDPLGRTALYYVSSQCNSQAVKFLLENGAHFEETDDLTLLFHTACEKNDLFLVDLFLKQGVDVNCASEKLQNALLSACFQGNTALVKLLLLHKANVYIPVGKGRSLLHIACSKGNVEMVKDLIDAGLDLHLKDSNGHTPFSTACFLGKKEIVDFLVSLKCDVMVRDNWLATGLHLSCKRGDSTLIEYLENLGLSLDDTNSKGVGPLHMAAHSGNLNLVNYLILRRPDLINTLTQNNISALHYGVFSQNVNIIKALLASGANVLVKSSLGVTALDYAVEMENKEIIALLEEHVICSKRAHKSKKRKEKNKALQNIKKLNALANNSSVEEKETSVRYVNANNNNSPIQSIETDDLPNLTEVQEECVQVVPDQHLYEVAYADKFSWPKGISDKDKHILCVKFEQLVDGHVDVKRLKGNDNWYRLRYGKYRVTFFWDKAAKKIYLIKVALRSKAYKMAGLR